MIVTKTDPKKSILKYMVNNHRYLRRITYDYDMYEIYIKETENPIGYLLKYNVPNTKNKTYIDIFIRSGYRNNGYGTKSILYFIKNIIEEDTVMVICDDKYKSKFLTNVGFVKDDICIYKNLYKYHKKEMYVDE